MSRHKPWRLRREVRRIPLSPKAEELEEDVCPSEEVAAYTRLLVCSKVGKDMLCPLSPPSFLTFQYRQTYVLNVLCRAQFAGRSGIIQLRTGDGINSPFRGTLVEDEEEVVSLLMVGTRESIPTEGPSQTMEEVFGDLYQEGHHASIAFPEDVKGVVEEPETATTEEVIIDRGHEEGMQSDQVCEEGSPKGQHTTDSTGKGQPATEESVLKKHPTIPRVTAPSPAPNVSSAQKSSSLSRQY